MPWYPCEQIVACASLIRRTPGFNPRNRPQSPPAPASWLRLGDPASAWSRLAARLEVDTSQSESGVVAKSKHPERNKMNLMITAHLKRSFDSWKVLFDNDDSVRANYCDESKTMVGKVDDKTALIALFDVDQAKMNARLSSPEFAKLVEDYVERHDLYTLDEMAHD